MICGMFGIMCAGGVYCPLNPTDQHERVASILDQIGGQYVLLHGITRHKFPSTAVPYVVRLDNILVSSLRVEDIEDIPDCREYGPAYIIFTSGDAMKHQEWTHFLKFLTPFNPRTICLFGLSECHVPIGCQIQDIDGIDIPIGYPLPGNQCLLIGEQGDVISNTNNHSDIGEIHIAGSTLFNCYLDEPERTTNRFVTIQNQVYLKTGDLARYNTKEELIYVGRIDFQMKVHGQRVEPAEIENTIETLSLIIELQIGVASFAQQRLWMDENIRFNDSFNEQISAYNELLIYRLTSTTSLSTDRLRQALTFIIGKHEIFRTAVIYDQDKLIQKILPISNDLFDLETTCVMNDTHLKQIVLNEEINRSLFDLEQGRVFRCHVLRQSFNNNDDNNLKQDDIILFNFHHIAIDGSSIMIFINDLRQALTMQASSNNNEDNMTYIDYAQYERLEDWSSARQYWNNVLSTLNNSIDQQNSSIRSGKGCAVTFDLDHNLVINLNRFISQSNLTLFQSTISTMSMRLKNIFDQLFSISSIYQFSLLLPHEVELIRDLNNTFVDYCQIGCIHWDFAYQAHLHPQKVALVLENGSMTYGELLYYAQQVANHLITTCTVQSGQMVCQLIERSFEMVIGMIGIWMSGGVYTPLNLHDPDTQLNAYIQQTDAHLILVHQPTHDQLLSQCLSINTDEVIGFAHMNEEITTCIDLVNVTSEHISHIIFTKEHSGLLKAVQLRHRNFISSIRSIHIQPTDTVLHHTSVNFDVHLLEIVGTLIMGGQVILLHPNGNL
ncbi:unnamed protein product, partial [Rotaria sordida]